MSFHPAHPLGRVELAVETMTALCEDVSGMEIGPELTKHFLTLAVADWVCEEDDRQLFTTAVCVAWNDKQDQIRRKREY